MEILTYFAFLRSPYSDCTQSCRVCTSEVSADYKLSDFIHDDRYQVDTTIAVSYEQALHMLQYHAGPVFIDGGGRRVRFDGLDPVLQSAMITTVTQRITDREDFIRSMPKGRWSDYNQSSLSKLSERVTEAGRMHGNGTAETTPEQRRNSTDERDRRRDSGNIGADTVGEIFHQALLPRIFQNTCLEPPCARYHQNPHDKIAFINEYRTIAKRSIPAVKLNWHASKYRVSLTLAELLAKFGEDHVVVQAPLWLAEGGITSTLSRASPLDH